jgi:hypothetical protein
MQYARESSNPVGIGAVGCIRAAFGKSSGRGCDYLGCEMKNVGVVILIAGLALGGYALTMDVSVDVPARDFGYGVSTPAMQVANIDRMAQRQNLLIFSGILSVVGAILFGFGSVQSKRDDSLQPANPPSPASPEEDEKRVKELIAAPPSSFSICSKCRHMGSGDDTACQRCGAVL